LLDGAASLASAGRRVGGGLANGGRQGKQQDGSGKAKDSVHEPGAGGT
jgi:hypothetical protein